MNKFLCTNITDFEKLGHNLGPCTKSNFLSIFLLIASGTKVTFATPVSFEPLLTTSPPLWNLYSHIPNISMICALLYYREISSICHHCNPTLPFSSGLRWSHKKTFTPLFPLQHPLKLHLVTFEMTQHTVEHILYNHFIGGAPPFYEISFPIIFTTLLPKICRSLPFHGQWFFTE